MNDSKMFKYIAQGFALVSEAAGSTFAGFAIGYLIDRFAVVTKPWAAVAMTFIGLILGFYRMYLIYMRIAEEKEE